MFRISQLMSTPVASSSGPDRKYAGELSPTCIFPSFACDFLAGDSSFDCCSTDSLTGSYLPCRRSPRLLTNGYYIWTEDSVLCDGDGHITLSPSQTSVVYKENSVRIFRKKKRIRHSFSSLLDLRAPKSWLQGSIFGDIDSSPGDDVWLEGVSRLDMHHCNKNGGDRDGSLADDWESEKQRAEASSSGPVTPETPRKSPHGSPLQSQRMASDHLQGNVSDHSKTGLLGEISFQTVLLPACLIIAACARWLLGGMLAGAFTCSCAVTVAYVVKLLFLGFSGFFKATACARRVSPVLSSSRPRRPSSEIWDFVLSLPKFDSHSGEPLMNVFNLNIRKLSNLQPAWNQLLYWKGVSKQILEKHLFNLVV